MKKTILLVGMLATVQLFAQPSKPVTEENPYIEDGIEYGYSIKNVSTKEVSNKDFSRYEVTLYATNKSECSRVVLLDQGISKPLNDIKTLAKFDCLNATGARLTSKSGEVSAKPMFVTARVNTRDMQGKSVVENQKVQIGYYIGAGETVQDNVIFIVPLNDKPDLKVRILNKISTL